MTKKQEEKEETKEEVELDLKEQTTISIQKYALQKLSGFEKYVDAYSLKSHNRGEAILLLIKFVDYKKLNKFLDKTNEMYEVEV